MVLRILSIFCLVVLLTSKAESKCIEIDEILCESESCKSYAELVKSNLDETVDPCDNFYQFSCGNYIRTHKLKDDEYEIGMYQTKFIENKIKLSELLNNPISDSDNKWVKNAKTFYKSCIDLDSVEKNTEGYMLKLIDDLLGGWPLANGLENKYSAFEMMQIIYGAQTSFLNIGVNVDPKNPKAHIIKIRQPDTIPYDFFITEEYKKAYKSYYKKIVEIISQRTDLENVDKEIDDMYSLSKSLKKNQIKLRDQLDAENDNVELKIADLEKQFPGFPWFEFITNAMFGFIDGIQIDKNERVSVDNWDYFVEMHKIFDDYSKNNKRAIQNLVIGNFFSTYSDFLPEKYLKANLIMKEVILGVTSLSPRNIDCVEKAQILLADETGYLYTSTYFSKKAKDDVKSLTESILAEMVKMIKESDWMDDTSKAKALEKAHYINKQVGYPDSFDDPNYIETHNNYTLDSENYLRNALIIGSYSEREALSKLREKVDDKKWFVSPSIMNAFYLPENNHIYILAGISTQPFYDFELPKYINYGSIGLIIGHEITHAFDSFGRKYDKDGKFFNDKEEGLWTQKTIDTFKDRTNCMIEQYSNFFVKEANMRLDGKQTLAENIADNGGAKSAFRAYENLDKNNLESQAKLPGLEKYTQDQMFFIGLSQPWCSLIKREALILQIFNDFHSVNEFRIVGISANSQYFRRAFGCDDRNKTVVNQCEVW